MAWRGRLPLPRLELEAGDRVRRIAGKPGDDPDEATGIVAHPVEDNRAPHRFAAQGVAQKVVVDHRRARLMVPVGDGHHVLSVVERALGFGSGVDDDRAWGAGRRGGGQ